MESKIKKYLSDPWMAYCAFTSKGLTKWVSDRTHLRLMHRAKLGMWPSIDSPVTFTEKMQWLKLNDHNPAYTTMVDKYRARTSLPRVWAPSTWSRRWAPGIPLMTSM